MKKLAFGLMFILMLAGLATYARAQSASGVLFTSQLGNSHWTTVIRGTAERQDAAGGIQAYQGNVVVSEIGGHVQIRADRVTYDEAAKEFVLQGNVRLSVAE